MKTEISFGLNLTDCTPKMPEMLMPEMLNTFLCVDRSYIQLWPKKKKEPHELEGNYKTLISDF